MQLIGVIQMNKRYMQTNGKLEQSSVYTYAFNLPAIDTCPGAGDCVKFCFAAIEQKQYPSALKHRQDSFALSKSPDFIETINAELAMLRTKHKKRGTKFAIRMHASGDFYSPAYILAWATVVEMNSDIHFYCYTKSVALFKRMNVAGTFSNWSVIYSLSGTMDRMIDINKDRHARIFADEQSLYDAGYVLASEDDTIAWQSTNNKIGLVIFGAKRKQFVQVA